MQTLKKYWVAATIGVWLATSTASIAAEKKTHQLTGTVVEATATKIVVEKGNEKTEFLRTPDTKVSGDIKVGDKVTVHYSMNALVVESKSDKEDKEKK